MALSPPSLLWACCCWEQHHCYHLPPCIGDEILKTFSWQLLSIFLSTSSYKHHALQPLSVVALCPFMQENTGESFRLIWLYGTRSAISVLDTISVFYRFDKVALRHKGLVWFLYRCTLHLLLCLRQCIVGLGVYHADWPIASMLLVQGLVLRLKLLARILAYSGSFAEFDLIRIL